MCMWAWLGGGGGGGGAETPPFHKKSGRTITEDLHVNSSLQWVICNYKWASVSVFECAPVCEVHTHLRGIHAQPIKVVPLITLPMLGNSSNKIGALSEWSLHSHKYSSGDQPVLWHRSESWPTVEGTNVPSNIPVDANERYGIMTPSARGWGEGDSHHS
jgi:hypothetical protein